MVCGLPNCLLSAPSSRESHGPFDLTAITIWYVHCSDSCLDSPRVYTSTNPWRLTASFKAVSSTREEYLAVIDHLKAILPVSKGKKRPKNEQNHADLIHKLEQRVDTIDQELNVSPLILCAISSFLPLIIRTIFINLQTTFPSALRSVLFTPLGFLTLAMHPKGLLDYSPNK